MEDTNVTAVSEAPIVTSAEVPTTAPVVETVGEVTPVATTGTVVESKPKARKPKAKKVEKKTKKGAKVEKKAEKKEGEAKRGRPPVYVGAAAKEIARLAKKYGATNAMLILRSTSDDRRSAKLFPEAVGISMPTILKIAHAAGVEFQMGRPSKDAA